MILLLYVYVFNFNWTDARSNIIDPISDFRDVPADETYTLYYYYMNQFHVGFWIPLQSCQRINHSCCDVLQKIKIRREQFRLKEFFVVFESQLKDIL